MKHWLETRQIAARLRSLLATDQPGALATVVGVRGSAYRRPGAKLLVAADGSSVGNVSGGCLEQDVREVALRVMETGRSELRAYCSGSDPVEAWDLGLGCEGEVEVYVRPVREDLAGLSAALDGEEPFALCTRVAEGDEGRSAGLLVSAGAVAGTLGDETLDAMAAGLARLLPEGEPSGLHQVSGQQLFIDRFSPPPRLWVFGAGDDARPLVRLALESGFRVTVVDRRPALLDADRFPPPARLLLGPAAQLQDRLQPDGEAFALLMTHSFADDAAWLHALAARPFSYLGILGPRARTERLLQAAGVEELAGDPRLYGPVGLDLGTEGAEQVAIAIVAELLAVRSGRSGGSLRDRCLPIHAVAG